MNDASARPQFPRLFSPGSIGTLELRNRLIMCPMGEGLANPDGTVSDRQINYYGARARGGVGLVTVGSAVVAYPRAAFSSRMTAISDPKYLPGLRALATRAHDHGARIAPQLVHDGQYALEDMIAGRPLLVPSPFQPRTPDRIALMMTTEEQAARNAPFQAPAARLEYRVATEEDIAAVIEQFVGAAALAREAGFDGVELHAGHGYLIDSFLSPVMNRRTDQWGGTIENRARLLCEIVRSIRLRLGRDFPVWCRLNARERFVAGGETLGDAIEIAKRAVAAGLDAIHLTINANPAMGITATAGHTPHEPGALLDDAAAMKAALDAPVIAFGRIGPDMAEQALADGKADFIAMGRKLLADPELPNKLARGAAGEIRPCIYQYRCVGNLYFRSSIACAVNPAIGHETSERDGLLLDRANRKKKRRLLVVGGGPAGLEAARLLADGGNHVLLAESQSTLGGALALAAEADPDLQPLLEWLRRQVDRPNIEIRLGQAGNAQIAREFGADGIIVATGARWLRPTISGADLPIMSMIDDRAWTRCRPADRVIVLGGGKPGLTIAASVAGRGARVIILEAGEVPGSEMPFPARARWVDELDRLGVNILCSVALEQISPHGIVWRSADRSLNSAPADLIVAACRAAPVEPILFDMPTDIPIHRIGDGVGIATVELAMRSAAAAAAALAATVMR
jgi:2,4-dienoyl-CoA reductase-like NADH-dependent reductase (Old Yellow Enzyme family)/thioredoxin reductase